MSWKNKILRRKGTGWRPDEIDSRDYSFASGYLDTPDHVDLTEFEPPIFDQSGKNSCVAEAVIAAMMMTEKRAGRDVIQLSRLFAYWNSRKAHLMNNFDMGTSIRICVEQIRKVGICHEEFWGYDEPVNKKPRVNAYMESVPYWDYRYMKIKETGQARVEAVKAALAEGCPVLFGTLIPSDFGKFPRRDMDLRPKDHEKFLGGHAMLIVGYTIMNGIVWFLVRNSWGDDFGNAGRIELGEEWIKWDATRDLTVLLGGVM